MEAVVGVFPRGDAEVPVEVEHVAVGGGAFLPAMRRGFFEHGFDDVAEVRVLVEVDAEVDAEEVDAVFAFGGVDALVSAAGRHGFCA